MSSKILTGLCTKRPHCRADTGTDALVMLNLHPNNVELAVSADDGNHQMYIMLTPETANELGKLLIQYAENAIEYALELESE